VDAVESDAHAVSLRPARPAAKSRRHVRRGRLVADAMTQGEELEGVRIEIERWN
jgi:hypothetical protein